MIFDKDGKAKRPTWFHMPAADILEWLDVLDDGDDTDIIGAFELKAEEEPTLLEDMGKLFINALVYFRNRENGIAFDMDRDYRLLYKRIKASIDNSYKNYFQAVENGNKNKPHND